MDSFPEHVASSVGRRTFLRRSSAVALGAFASLVGARSPAGAGSPKPHSALCAIYCVPIDCTDTGCGGGDDIYHCTGCGNSFYRCFSDSRGCRGFCYSQNAC